MHEPRSPAPPPSSLLLPKEEPLKCALMRSLPRHYRTSSRPDGFSIASGDTLIPDTEPEITERLWEHIRKDLESMPPKSLIPTKEELPENEQDKKSKSRSGAPSETSSLPIRTGDTSTDITLVSSAKIRKASPSDKDFYEQILKPCGIIIDEEHENVTVWEHFKTEKPGQDHISFYKKKASEHSVVWLDADEDFLKDVANEYRCMTEGHMCEAEFASYAKEKLFLRDPRVSYHNFSDLRVWKTDRMLELVAKPNEGSFKCWLSPPILKNKYSTKTYDFDIRPDCAYWLSLQAFNTNYATKVQHWAFVVKNRVTCPYLFIEFKKDDNDFSTAKNQLAVAASLALYNRFNLRIQRIKKDRKSLDPTTFEDIRVYGITLQGASFMVWYIQPELRETTCEWAGCIMTRIFHGSCESVFDIEEFIDWINEIHCWGLGVHGPSCQKDIKICVRERYGYRVSDTLERLE